MIGLGSFFQVTSAVLIIWVAWANSLGNVLNVFWLRIVFGGYCTSWIKFPIQWQLFSKHHNDSALTWWQVKTILGQKRFENLSKCKGYFHFIYITSQGKGNLGWNDESEEHPTSCWNDLLGDIWDMWLWCWHTGDCSQFAGLPSIETIPWMLGMVMRILVLCSCVNILNVKELEIKQIKNVWCEILKCNFGFWDQTCEGSIWVYVCVFTW